jgi:drug/metabolite transporter (DMT)-like permease
MGAAKMVYGRTVGRLGLSPSALGWLMAVTATVCYSFATPTARSAIRAGFDPNALLFGRMVLAVALMLVTILATDRRLLRVPARGLNISLGAGFVNGIGMLLYFWGLTRLEASMAAMIISTSPLMVLSILYFGGEKLTYRHLVRLGLALAGVYLLVGPGGSVDMVGILLVLAAMFAFAWQVVLIQWYLHAYDARPIAFYQMLAMTVVIAGWWLSHGAVWTPPTAAGWSAIVVLAVFSTYIARLLMFNAVPRIGGGQMAMLSPLETFLSVIWSILFLGEHLTALQWLGGLLVMVSAALAIQRLSLGRRPRWRVSARV